MDTDGSSVSVTYAQLRRTSVHTHAGVLEIVLVLRGELDVTVSCERFVLSAGDYAVLNEGDPHSFVGTPDTLIAVLQVRLDAFAEDIPGLAGIIYACESFDLPRFRRTEVMLRATIIRAVLADGTKQRALVATLLIELSNGYAFEDYYARHRTLTMDRRLQFRSIVSSIQERLSSRDVLGQIAHDQHYRKDSLSRIVREATAVSFSDLLTYLRVSSAERRLVTGDHTVAEIAAACGFSDVKYLTRAFRAWFGESPAAYRRRMKPLRSLGDDVADGSGVGRALAEHLLDSPPTVPDSPRLSITPLLLKNLGGRADLYRSLAELARTRPPIDEAEAPRVPHYLPIRVAPGSIPPVDWVGLLQGIDRARYLPTLLLPADDAELSHSIVREATLLSLAAPAFWVTYENGFGARAEELARELSERHGVTAIPMYLG